MTFDDLKEKWQAHDHQLQLNIDANLLLREVRRNHRALESQLWWRDINEIMAALLITTVFTVLAVLLEQWTLILCALGSLFVGVFFIVDRVKQRRQDSIVEESLQSTIDASLAQVQHQIWLLRNVLWWYLLPLMPGLALFLLSASWQSRQNGPAEQLVIAGVAAICAVAFWQVHRTNLREIVRTLEPRRVELEELSDSLKARSPRPNSSDSSMS